MAANDDFPRNWDIYAEGAAGAINPTLIVAAFAGITHVLTAINFTAWNSGAASGFQPPIAVNGTTIANWLGVATLIAGTGETQWDWTGKIICPVGTALSVIAVSGVPTATGCLLEIQGYDV